MIGHLVVGPEQHGVVTFARDLARHAGGPLLRIPVQPDEFDADLVRALAAASDVVHLQFTDGLYGDRCDVAAERFVTLRAAVPGPVSVTLHDLPDPADDAGRYARRRQAYRRVADAVDAVVVSSRYEAGLLDAAAGRPVGAGVVPLPVRRGAGRPRERVRAGEVGLLGYVHPGKGYAEALAELGGVPAALSVTALGRAADGHEDLLPQLADAAARAGHRWRTTGFVPEADLPGRLRQVAVPLAPNHRVSASGSINSWLAAGRRPLVADGGYAREVAERLPGALRVYRPGELAGAVTGALADPSSTWLDDGCVVGPGSDGTARAYRRLLAAAC